MIFLINGESSCSSLGMRPLYGDTPNSPPVSFVLSRNLCAYNEYQALISAHTRAWV